MQECSATGSAGDACRLSRTLSGSNAVAPALTGNAFHQGEEDAGMVDSCNPIKTSAPSLESAFEFE